MPVYQCWMPFGLGGDQSALMKWVSPVLQCQRRPVTQRERERVCVYNESKRYQALSMEQCFRQTSASHKSTTLSKGSRFCCLFGFMTQAWMWALGVCVRHGRWTRSLRCWCVMLFHTPQIWSPPLHIPGRRGGGWMDARVILRVSMYMHRADICSVHAGRCVRVCMIVYMQR